MSTTLIEEYTQELQARGQSPKSTQAYKQLLTDLERIAPLETYTKADLIKYFNSLTTSPRYGPKVKPKMSTIQVKMKLAMKFFRDQNKPEVIAWIKLKKLPETLKDTDILSDNEVALMIETAKTHYSKALIGFLFDTGCRISEAMSIKYTDLHMMDDNILVHIPTTKTAIGYRKTVLTYSGGLIRNLETYTERSNNDRIFCLSYSQNSRLVKEIAENAGLEKRVTLHLLRHSRATELVRNGTPESVIKKELGWSQNSPMINRYVHLNDDDVIRSKLEKAGIVAPVIHKTEVKAVEPINIISNARKITGLKGDVEGLTEIVELQGKRNEELQAEILEMKKRMAEMMAALHNE